MSTRIIYVNNGTARLAVNEYDSLSIAITAEMTGNSMGMAIVNEALWCFARTKVNERYHEIREGIFAAVERFSSIPATYKTWLDDLVDSCAL